MKNELKLMAEELILYLEKQSDTLPDQLSKTDKIKIMKAVEKAYVFGFQKGINSKVNE